MTQPEYSRSRAEILIDAIKSYEQADMEGIMVLVSRQACEEIANQLAGARDLIDRLGAEMIVHNGQALACSEVVKRAFEAKDEEIERLVRRKE